MRPQSRIARKARTSRSTLTREFAGPSTKRDEMITTLSSCPPRARPPPAHAPPHKHTHAYAQAHAHAHTRIACTHNCIVVAPRQCRGLADRLDPLATLAKASTAARCPKSRRPVVRVDRRPPSPDATPSHPASHALGAAMPCSSPPTADALLAAHCARWQQPEGGAAMGGCCSRDKAAGTEQLRVPPTAPRTPSQCTVAEASTTVTTAASVGHCDSDVARKLE
jgi:hypothetical protein